MLILTLRTDKPDAEIGLYRNSQEIIYETWKAHRELAETLHNKIDEILKKANIRQSDIDGVVGYKGPGSFTGLRIGLSVCNALASSLNIPAAGTGGEGWRQEGVFRLLGKENDQIIMPEYGGNANITLPRK